MINNIILYDYCGNNPSINESIIANKVNQTMIGIPIIITGNYSACIKNINKLLNDMNNFYNIIINNPLLLNAYSKLNLHIDNIFITVIKDDIEIINIKNLTNKQLSSSYDLCSIYVNGGFNKNNKLPKIEYTYLNKFMMKIENAIQHMILSHPKYYNMLDNYKKLLNNAHLEITCNKESASMINNYIANNIRLSRYYVEYELIKAAKIKIIKDYDSVYISCKETNNSYVFNLNDCNN